jgi:predicted alpha/beta-hydrolase family hydrolase
VPEEGLTVSRRALSRFLQWAGLALGALAVIAVAGFLVWATNPLGPNERALAALKSDASVRVTEWESWYLFEPAWSDVMQPGTSTQATIGLVFYPGGHVDVRSYAPLCRRIAAQGVLVALQPMPLSLAVFRPDAGKDPISAFPDVKTWGVAGHSLGGAMAAQWFSGATIKLDGLALLGAYPPSGIDLSGSSAAFVSVYGSNDGAADSLPRAKAQLPPDTPFVVIEGGNHGQIGDYGPQPGDGVATISAEEEQRQVAEAVVAMLRRAVADASP